MSNFTTTYMYTEVQMTELANQAKEQIVFALASEGLLKGDPEDISREYVVVLHQKGFFGKIYDRFRGTDKDGTFFAVLKSVQYGATSGGSKPKKEKKSKKVKATHLTAPLPGKKED